MLDIKGHLLERPDEVVRLLSVFRWPLAAQIRMHASKRSAQDAAHGITEGPVTQPLPEAVALAKVFNTNGDVTHASHRVRERLFHFAEIVQTGD